MSFNKIIFFESYMKIFRQNNSEFVKKINDRCPSYKKNDKNYKKSMNKNIENFINHCIFLTLKDLNINVVPAICEHHSDFSFENESFFLHIDAKGCLENDNDFIENKNGLNIHVGDSQTLNHVSSFFKDKKQNGLQIPVIEEKPVITLLAFIKWSFKDVYNIISYGIADCSPYEYDKINKCGKSEKELRFCIINKNLYKIEFIK